MPDRLSERDDLTLRTLALLDRTTIAEQRRRALAAYARQARQEGARQWSLTTGSPPTAPG